MAFGLDDVLAEGLKIVNKFIPDPAQRAAAELEIVRMKQAGEFKELEVRLQMEQELTKRAAADMTSDSKLSKNIRPIIMLYLLTIITLLGFGVISPVEGFVVMIKSFTELGLMFYFGGRTLEKSVSMISEKFGKKGN